MPKKSAVAVVVTVAALVLVSSVAVALNLGIVASTRSEPAAIPTVVVPEVTDETELAVPAASTDAEASTSSEDSFSPFPDGTEVVTVFVDEPATVTPQATATAPGGTPGSRSAGAATTAPRGETTYPVHAAGPAGEVALEWSPNGLAFWGAYPSSNAWTYTVEENGREVVVRFTDGTRIVRFHAELDDGAISVEVGERVVTPPGPVTSTDDDHDDRDDDHDDRDDRRDHDDRDDDDRDDDDRDDDDRDDRDDRDDDDHDDDDHDDEDDD